MKYRISRIAWIVEREWRRKRSANYSIWHWISSIRRHCVRHLLYALPTLDTLSHVFCTVQTTVLHLRADRSLHVPRGARALFVFVRACNIHPLFMRARSKCSYRTVRRLNAERARVGCITLYCTLHKNSTELARAALIMERKKRISTAIYTVIFSASYNQFSARASPSRAPFPNPN